MPTKRQNDNTPPADAPPPFEPVERVIKHGLFTYHELVPAISPEGQEVNRLAERLAFQGQKVLITRPYDLARGEEHGAFFTESELAAQRPSLGVEPEAEEVELADLDHSELVDYLMSTGAFDGNPQPTAPEVIEAAGDDPELAERLLSAENEASGGSPREPVVEGLTKIKDAEPSA